MRLWVLLLAMKLDYKLYCFMPPYLYLHTCPADRVEKCTNVAQLENLLSASFPYMSIPELKAIPMRVITKLKEIRDLPQNFLDQLIQRPSLLNDLPLQIKQQVRIEVSVAGIWTLDIQSDHHRFISCDGPGMGSE